ncbi:MAG: alpha/beta hydrolase [Roseiflexaceae bacterium]
MSLAGMQQMSAKQRAVVDGAAIEYITVGNGHPAIVLINGSGGPVEGWYKVFGPLAQQGTVLAYNRPGVGGSARPLVAQTGDVLVASLRGLLGQAGLEPPYVLVGHSFGGLIANLFARTFPAEVAGVVLLDATAPEDVAAMAAHQNAAQRLLKRTLDRLFGRDPLAESEHAAQTVAQIRQAGPFPAVPLVVVTGGKPAMSWATPAAALAARATHQRELVALSPHGRQIIAARSGHFPQFSEPELVVEAVRQIVQTQAEMIHEGHEGHE